MKNILSLIFTISFVLLNTKIAIALEMGIVTGGKSGTYIKIGQNISELVSKHNINLNVYPSKGSLQNAQDVFNRPGVQLGIVQSDVLYFIQSVNNDFKLKKIARKLRMIFPLYNEEIHILANQNISEFDDLQGKRVAVGSDGSGTWLTSSFLFNISEVTPSHKVPLSGKKALNALKNNEIDAMIYVAGFPISLFDKEVSGDDKLHLVPILNKDIREWYPVSKIPANTYKWNPEEIDTVAVKATLITYNYRNKGCRDVGNLAKIVYQNFSELLNNGHNKWGEVDLDASLKGWKQYECVTNKIHNTNTNTNNNANMPTNDVSRAVYDILKNMK